MDANQDRFHSVAINSILFKGHSEWYFCFLKSERIAHALALLAAQPSDTGGELRETAHLAAQVPQSFLQFAAGNLSPEAVLADLFALLSEIRVHTTAKHLSQENSSILVQECEALIERLAVSTPMSPFMSPSDFEVSEGRFVLGDPYKSPTPRTAGTSGSQGQNIKDNKGQSRTESKGHHERTQQVLDFVLQNKGVSIKDITTAVQGYSVKTIQRELAFLVAGGLIKKVGERRWSTYLPL